MPGSSKKNRKPGQEGNAERAIAEAMNDYAKYLSVFMIIQIFFSRL
jgi:hypothetical protein